MNAGAKSGKSQSGGRRLKGDSSIEKANSKRCFSRCNVAFACLCGGKRHIGQLGECRRHDGCRGAERQARVRLRQDAHRRERRYGQGDLQEPSGRARLQGLHADRVRVSFSSANIALIRSASNGQPFTFNSFSLTGANFSGISGLISPLPFK